MVLGATLFLIYINDLLFLENQVQGQIISFADDTALLFEGILWKNVKQANDVLVDITN